MTNFNFVSFNILVYKIPIKTSITFHYPILSFSWELYPWAVGLLTKLAQTTVSLTVIKPRNIYLDEYKIKNMVKQSTVM